MLVVGDAPRPEPGALSREAPALEEIGQGGSDAALLDEPARGRTAAVFADDDLTQIPARSGPREAAGPRSEVHAVGYAARALWGMLVLGLAIGLFVGVGIGLSLAR